METLSQSSVLLAPWIFGYVLALICYRVDFFSRHAAIVFGGVASAVAVIFLPVSLLHLTAHWSHDESPFSARFALYASAAAIGLGLLRCSSSWAASFTKSSFLAMAMLSVIVLIAVVLSTVAPLQSWDGLSYWASKGMEVAEYYKTSANAPFQHASRHPITLSALMLYSSQTSEIPNHQGFVISAWGLLTVSNVVMIFGTALALTKNIRIAAGSAFLYATIPLVENHAGLHGYAELPIATMVLASTALFLCGSLDNKRLLWILGCMCAASCVALKNTGAIYMAIPVIGVISSFVIRAWKAKGPLPRPLKPLTLLSLFSLFSITVFVLYNFFTRGGPFFFGGYYLKFQGQSLSNISSILYTSIISNTSFQMCGLLSFLGLVMLIRRPTPRRFDLSHTLCISTLLAGMFVGFLTLFIDYMARYSDPGFDTSFSRFLVPIFSLTPLAFASLSAHLVDDAADRNMVDASRLENGPV